MRARVARLPGIRTVKDHRLIVRAFDVRYRSRLVRERLRFFAREWTGKKTAAYRLAGSGVTVHLRHGSSDLDILEEIFGMGLYDPPPEALADVPERPRVVDLGGHVGLFGAWALARWPAASITTVEADPVNAAVLRRTVEAGGADWTVVEGAASTQAGTLRFRSGDHAESALDPEGDLVVTAIDALELLAGADVAKIDIEGGEWPILTDPRFAGLPLKALALEHHPAGAPQDDFDAAAHRILRDAGYETYAVPGAPAGAGMLWAWRRATTRSSS